MELNFFYRKNALIEGNGGIILKIFIYGILKIKSI